jgi:divalent metal cation (Fe/Co/Zn/Cd) transporter
MIIEAAVSLFAAWRARSPALLAFGGDSGIELASAVVVFCRFRANAVSEYVERRSAQIAGALLFGLAAFVVTVSLIAMLGYREPKPNPLGIAILIAAAVFMPLLASGKRRLAVITGSAALRADAVESGVCGYLSLIALLGLLVNAVWRVRWADPVVSGKSICIDLQGIADRAVHCVIR